MTDLTEKWKKGELNQGYYYTKYTPKVGKPFVEIELRNYLLDLAKFRDADTVEVLATVPTYEEWQKVLNIDFNNEVLRLENAKLKELLKECREILDYAKDFAYHDPCCKCIAKINQALGEK